MKHFVFYHFHSGFYQLVEYNDSSMESLFIFMGDGLLLESYVNFLNDKNRTFLCGNVCELVKNEDLVTVNVDQNILSGLSSFTWR